MVPQGGFSMQIFSQGPVQSGSSLILFSFYTSKEAHLQFFPLFTIDTCKEKKNLHMGLFAGIEWEKEQSGPRLHTPLSKYLHKDASLVEP